MNSGSNPAAAESAAAADDAGARTLRALAVLERVAASSQPVTVPQLALWLAIPRPSVARLVARLVADRYLLALPEAHAYVPGPRAIGLARASLGHGSFRRECRAVLRGLVHALGETCNVAALDGDQVVLLERVESEQPLRMHLEVGSRAPLHCTAGGKLFLATMPARQRAALLDALPLPALTAQTLTDRAALDAELDRLAVREIGIDNEEFVRGMVGIAVPVARTDAAARSGGATVAVVCHAATARLRLQDLLGFSSVLREAASRLAGLW